jgi:VWFA-related protein
MNGAYGIVRGPLCKGWRGKVRVTERGAVRGVVGALALMCLLVPSLVFAQSAPLGVAIHRIDSGQFPTVLTYVSVVDSRGVPVAGLDAAAFELLEDGKPVAGAQVAAVADSQEPIAVALVVDVSGSMNDEGKLDGAKAAGQALIDALGPRDSAALISFADDVKVVHGFTADTGALKGALNGLTAKGDTALYDGLGQTALLMQALSQPRKVIVLLSDGADTKSTRPMPNALAAAREARSVVFAVGLGGDARRDVLDAIARETAGQVQYVEGVDRLTAAFRSIADQLRHHYVIRHRSALPADGKPHDLLVRASYDNRKAEATRQFPAVKPPLLFDVVGIVDGEIVGGRRRIEAIVRSGDVKKVDLLVDDQLRATAAAAPFILSFDPDAEVRGRHRVVVRATDALGETREQTLAVELTGQAAPPPATVVPPAPTPTVALAVPTPVPVEQPSPWFAFAAAAVLVGLVAAIALLLALRGRRKASDGEGAPVEANPERDKTEDMGTLEGGIVAIAQGILAAKALPEASLRAVVDGAEYEIALTGRELTIGRGPENALVLADPLVSRRHARIMLEDGAYWVEDLESRNGTLVNGEETARRALAAEDEITIGGASLAFKMKTIELPPPSTQSLAVSNGKAG